MTNLGLARRYRRPDRVRIDVEKFEVLGRGNIHHWCNQCKQLTGFTLNEVKWEWNCDDCGRTLLIQQLIIEGLLSESKYRGIEHC